MHRLSPKQYAQTLFEVLQDTAPQDQETVLNNFIDAIKINGDQNISGQILLEYSEISKIANSTSRNNELAIEELNKLAKHKNVNASDAGVIIKLDQAEPNDQS